MNLVSLPGTGRKTTQLGFGCAYLDSDGTGRIAARSLLDAAYNAGIRHFDTAPRYGQGFNEALVGRFLASHKGELTVTTKYGLLPPTPNKRIIDAIRRRYKFFPGFLFGPMGGKKASYRIADAKASLETSLSKLQVDHIDMFLMHEPEPSDLRNPELLKFLQESQKAGKIGSFGVGATEAAVPKLYAQRRSFCPVMMFEWGCHKPKLDLSEAYRMHFRTAAPSEKYFKSLLEKDPKELRRWCDAVDVDLMEGDNLYALCLKASIAAFPNSLILFSSRYALHIRRTVEIVEDSSLDKAAVKFLELAQSKAK